MFRNKFMKALLLNPRTLAAAATVLVIVGSYLHKQAPVVHAQSAVVTDYGNITSYGTGWSTNVVIVTTTAPFKSPSGCSLDATSQQYATLDTDPGIPAFHAALLGSLLSNKKVALAVQGCAFDHGRIIGVSVAP
jgi:hypothetical protein